ncbi:MAG: TIGR03960 family B12-binding radical SAM protein [Desulfobacterales bacterium]|nr:TIGR03960 family B12-binding radical SAM protein [Desulfobacterales bacterium]
MSRQSFEEILPLVRRPSHYLGSEINAVRKDPQRMRLRFALAFPDLYEVGMCHVGIQILYDVLNAREDIAAERIFAPGVELEAEMRAGNIQFCSLETRSPISGFDIVGFSLPYELTFTNILAMLNLSRIPLYARDRNNSHPFVIAGGPCAFNPEPLADFFDAIVIGDGEEVVLELADAWLEWKEAGADRQSLLKRWSGLEGVYVPSFFEAHTDAKGLQVLTPLFSGYTHVRKALVTDINRVPYPDHPVIPFGAPIHDRLSLEICRGCTRGCRFCQAGMIYRPVRERAPETVLSLAERALANTGYEDISLLSLSTGDYGAIQPLMERLMGRCAPEKIAVSLPSLRVGSLTESLMAQIKRVRKTGFTVAPEAGSRRLREVINKNITEEALEETVRSAFGLGWRVIKLYFMIGLPTETDADLDAIVRLVRRLQRLGGRGGRNKNITVSVSTFIPKAHTPFQWRPQIPVAESRDNIHMLRGKLKGRGIRFKWQGPEMSFLEGLFARGDRRLSRLLVKAYEMGCRFDGWSEQFEYKRWLEAIDSCGVDAPFYTTRARDISEPLAWDHIDCGVSKEYLGLEWERALAGSHTPDCRGGECNLCGVCDLETVKPVTFGAQAAVTVLRQPREAPEKPMFKRLRVSYAKLGSAKHFGHLELVKIFIRAFRRARIPLRFSEGFHPSPKVSFESALPVGIESTQEHLVCEAPVYVKPASLVERVNRQLPDGLTITACTAVLVGRVAKSPERFDYTVALKDATFSEAKLNDFAKSPTSILTKTNRKGRTKTIDLKQAVANLHLSSPRTARMTLDISSGHHVRVTDVLAHIFGLSERTLKLATIVKGPEDSA